MKKLQGVYIITINNKIYVGSSSDLLSRKYNHLCALKNKSHPNKKMQQEYNGHEEYDFKILLEVCSKEDLRIKEQQFIIELNSLNNGFNNNYAVRKTYKDRMNGFKIFPIYFTEEKLDKIRAVAKANFMSTKDFILTAIEEKMIKEK
jgi:group I intron endonuclease